MLDTQRAKSYRLATERKILFSCNSPFVIRTFYAFEDAARLFLVMECMHSDVKGLLEKLGALPEQQVVSLLALTLTLTPTPTPTLTLTPTPTLTLTLTLTLTSGGGPEHGAHLAPHGVLG